jgi:ubiquinone/menaquinone biosynthesis C-methylase UbiE
MAVRQVLGGTLRPGGLALTEQALAFCSLPPGARVLDVGCGAGATVSYLQTCGYRAGGVDLSALLLQDGLQNNPGVPLLQADGLRLPLAGGKLEAILAECSLSVLADRQAALAEFYRLLGPGDYLVVSDLYARDPAGLLALQALPLTSCLSGAISKAELISQLANLGFELALWEDHSEYLRYLAGQLALAHGSLAEFWRGAVGLDALDMQLAIAKAKPGYFLLIAKKQGTIG